MRAVIILSVLLTSFQVSSQVNKFLFSTGIKANVWNQSVLNKDMLFYYNMSDDRNYFIYEEAVRVVTENGFDFFNPTRRTDKNDDFVTLINIVYENAAYGSNAYTDLFYDREDIRIWVHLSEKGSRIVVYK